MAPPPYEPNSVHTFRRAHERVATKLPASIYELTGSDVLGVPIMGEVVDLSRGGMGLRCRRLIHVGRQIVALIRLADSTQRVLFCEIRNAAYTGEGFHQLGVQFIAIPTSPAVQKFIAEHGL